MVSYRMALEEDIEVYKDDVRILNLMIANLEKEVANLEKINSNDSATIKLLRDQLELTRQTRADLEQKITILERDNKKLRNGRNFWRILSGIVAAIGLGLYLKN